MKGISAYIREERVPFVVRALEKEGIFGMTLRGVMGRGNQMGISLQTRGRMYRIDMLPKVRLDVVVSDAMEMRALEAIRAHAFTGKIGDGRIFVMNIEESVRVRTGEVEA